MPTTLDMLFHAEPLAARQKRSWSGIVEGISRCIAAHQRGFAAAEHDACSRIQADICGHASTLRRLLLCNVDSTQLLTLLHRFIMNRSFNMALQEVIDQSLQDDYLVCPIGRRPVEHGRQILADSLEECYDIIQNEDAKLKTDMQRIRKKLTR